MLPFERETFDFLSFRTLSETNLWICIPFRDFWDMKKVPLWFAHTRYPLCLGAPRSFDQDFVILNSLFHCHIKNRLISGKNRLTLPRKSDKTRGNSFINSSLNIENSATSINVWMFTLPSLPIIPLYQLTFHKMGNSLTTQLLLWRWEYLEIFLIFFLSDWVFVTSQNLFSFSYILSYSGPFT